MRQALIYNQDQLAGLLTEDENGYTFQYDTAYIKSSDAESISLTLPISEKQRREKKPIFLCVDILLVPLCKEVHTLRKASSDLASKR